MLLLLGYVLVAGGLRGNRWNVLNSISLIMEKNCCLLFSITLKKCSLFEISKKLGDTERGG